MRSVGGSGLSVRISRSCGGVGVMFELVPMPRLTLRMGWLSPMKTFGSDEETDWGVVVLGSR